MTPLRLLPLLALFAAAPASAQLLLWNPSALPEYSASVGGGVGSYGPAVRVGLEHGGRLSYLVRVDATWGDEGDVSTFAGELSGNGRVRLVRTDRLDVAASGGIGLAAASQAEPGDIVPLLNLDVVVPLEAEASVRLVGPLRLLATGRRSVALSTDLAGEGVDLPVTTWSATLGLRLSAR